MGLYQSFRQIFVTNSPALLADGQTVDLLAVGQIGILDAKTHKAVANPTYAKNKALKAVWGTPDLNVGEFGGVQNENEYTPLIKGKQIIGFRSKKAQRGITPLYTIGWSGDTADTNTLFAKAGESKNLFIKLTGEAIDRIWSKQGITKLFKFTPQPVTDCDDPCAAVDCAKFTKEIVAQINRDKDLNKFIRASAIISCTTNETITETDCFKFKLDVCDTGDDYALGLVQSKYGQDKVKRISRVNAISTYEIVKNANTLPAAYTSSAISVPECPTCPAGATLVAEGFKYIVEVDAGTAITGVVSAVKLHTEGNRDTYSVLSADELVAADLPAGADFSFVGETRNICKLPATTIAWVANGTLKKRAKAYTLTVADDICGTNRLADIQAQYPDLVVSVVNAAGACVHTYTTTIQSNCYEVGCSVGDITYVAPAAFEGIEWKATEPTVVDNGCKCGILIETAFVNRTTNECTYDAFPYENDVVYVQASNYNPDFNADPNEQSWDFKQIRQVQFPMGHGQQIQKYEQDSKLYDGRSRSFNPVVREIQGYSLQANPNVYYDQYVLTYRNIWKSAGGWAEDYTATWELVIYVPEGTGSQIEQTFAGYLSSNGIDEDFDSIV